MSELNGAMALFIVMEALLAVAVLNSVSGLRWIEAKAGARAFWLENARAESRRWREIADAQYVERIRSYDVRPLDQVAGEDAQ